MWPRRTAATTSPPPMTSTSGMAGPDAKADGGRKTGDERRETEDGRRKTDVSGRTSSSVHRPPSAVRPHASSARPHPLRVFCPRYTAAALEEITPEALARLGIRAVILDLDNTLVAWHGEEVEERVAAWVAGLRAAGFALCIASNTHRPARLRRLAERLGIGSVSGVAKPRRGGFRRAMAAM